MSSNLEDLNIDDIVGAGPEDFSSAKQPVSEGTEFPSIGEVTDIDLSFMEKVENIANMRTMFARDDWSKAEIIQKDFKDDEKWGGLYKDKFNNPMIIWENQPYYVNKPGLSEQDLMTFAGDIAAFYPAGRAVAAMPTITTKILGGSTLYSATEGVRQLVEDIMAPKTKQVKNEKWLFDKVSDAGLTGSASATIEATLPIVGRYVSSAVRPYWQELSEYVKDIPEIADEKISKAAEFVKGKVTSKLDDLAREPNVSGKIPLTKGQRGAKEPIEGVPYSVDSTATPQIFEEDRIRWGDDDLFGPTAGAIIRNFDKRQLAEITNQAQQLMQAALRYGKGGADETVEDLTQSGELIGETIQSASDKMRKAAGILYRRVDRAEDAPIFDEQGIKDIFSRIEEKILQEVPPSALTGEEQSLVLKNMPILKSYVDEVGKILKRAENSETGIISFKEMLEHQQQLRQLTNLAQQSAGTGKTSNEARILRDLEVEFTDDFYNSVERGLASGEPEIIADLQKASGLWKNVMQLSGKGTAKEMSERSANAVLKLLTDGGSTPIEVVNKLFGAAKFVPARGMKVVLQKLKTNLPPEEYNKVMGLMRNAILQKAFTGTAGAISRSKILRNYNDIFYKHRYITKEFFSGEELKTIADFRREVAPTLWAEMKLNPSGTKYALFSALGSTGLFLPIARRVPIVSMAAKPLEEAATKTVAKSSAEDAVSQYVFYDNQKPLFDQTIAAMFRPSIPREDESGMPNVEPMDITINNLIQSINPETAEKIIQSVGEQ